MKSELEKLEGLNRKLTIKIPAEKVNDAFSEVYQGLKKNAQVKGFRKGKVPLHQLKSAYGDQVKNEVLERLLQDGYAAALQEHALDPIGFPKVRFDTFTEGQVFEFIAELEVRPPIELKKIEGLEIIKEKLEIPEDRVEKVIASILQEHSEAVPIFEDRGLAEGDLANIDFEGFVGSAPLEGGSAKAHLLEIGSKSFIPGFEDGLVGMRPSERRDIMLQFPSDYQVKGLAGQDVVFQVRLNSINRKSLPTLNAEFLKKFGEFNTPEDFKAAIRRDIEVSEISRINSDTKDVLLKALVAANPVAVPAGLHAKQKERIIADTKERMERQGVSEEDFKQYVSKWDKDFSESASFMVQSTFLVDEIARTQGLKAKDIDVEKRIRRHAESTGIPIDRLRDFYKEEDRRSNLRFQLTEENVLDYLLKNAKIKELPRSELAHDHPGHEHTDECRHG